MATSQGDKSLASSPMLFSVVFTLLDLNESPMARLPDERIIYKRESRQTLSCKEFGETFGTIGWRLEVGGEGSLRHQLMGRGSSTVLPCIGLQMAKPCFMCGATLCAQGAHCHVR